MSRLKETSYPAQKVEQWRALGLVAWRRLGVACSLGSLTEGQLHCEPGFFEGNRHLVRPKSFNSKDKKLSGRASAFSFSDAVQAALRHYENAKCETRT
eukprot:2358107-Amphidinium_carterae.2